MFKSTETSAGPRFSPIKFKRIVKALERQGIPVLQGEEGERFARMMGAEAIYYPCEPGQSGFLAFGRDPTRTQVVEELLHLGQHRKLGFVALEEIDIVYMELEAQDRLLRLGKRFGWSENELSQIGRARIRWQTRLQELESLS